MTRIVSLLACLEATPAFLLIGRTGAGRTDIAEAEYDPIKDFEPIGLVVDLPSAFLAKKDFPPKDLPGLIAHAKANKGKVNYAHAGIARDAGTAAAGGARGPPQGRDRHVGPIIKAAGVRGRSVTKQRSCPPTLDGKQLVVDAAESHGPVRTAAVRRARNEASRHELALKAQLLRRKRRELPVVRVLLTGAAQPRTDSVQRATEILKDRPLPKPKPKPDGRRNYGPPLKKAERRPA